MTQQARGWDIDVNQWIKHCIGLHGFEHQSTWVMLASRKRDRKQRERKTEKEREIINEIFQGQYILFYHYNESVLYHY